MHRSVRKPSEVIDTLALNLNTTEPAVFGISHYQSKVQLLLRSYHHIARAALASLRGETEQSENISYRHLP